MAFERKPSPKNSLGPITLGLLTLSLYVLVAGSPFGSVLKGWLTVNGMRSSSKQTAAIAEERSGLALLDAVTSIVQNYYVDGNRVENDQLLRGAAKSLAFAIPEAKLEETADSLTLKLRGIGFTIDHLRDLDYNRLLTGLKSLAKFCTDSRISGLITGSSAAMLGSENSSTAIVLNAMLSSLDAHSSLMSADGYKDLRQGTDGSFGGLGVLVGIKNHQLTVLKPMPRSPAMRMGLKKNDRILAIDGFPTFGLSLDQLITHMRGEPGSTALLSVLPIDGVAPRSIKVDREIIEVDSVEAKHHHKGNLHYLQLVVDSFSARTGKEVLSAIRKFKAKFPLTGVILDLRSNPGGLLDQAVEVSDIFLKEGVIVSTRGRRDEVERATVGVDELDYPVIVLMNEDSASASEIVAGALQDNARAIIVGQPSFGKGSVQTLFELPSERALKLTIARYLTPMNRSIQNTGIIPDVWLQPIKQRSENKNLLGSFRYRSEAFLPNHLSSVSANKNQEITSSAIKGFYLKSSENTPENEAIDRELEIAETILSKVQSLYGSRLPEGARRSSHLLALALPELRNQLSQQSEQASDWLKSNLGVNWGAVDAISRPRLSVLIDDRSLVARGGGKLSIPWTISNVGDSTARHVSIFVQSPISGMETIEQLLGELKAGESRRGTIEVDIATSLQPGVHRVIAGSAIEGLATEDSSREFSIQVSPGEFAELITSGEFVDGLGGNVTGQLEPGETGFIRLALSNPSDLEIKKLNIEFVNLAGSQIKLGTPAKEFDTMKRRSTLEIKVPVAADQNLSNGPIAVGYVLRSESLNGAVAKIVNVDVTAPRVRQASQRMTH